MEESAPGVRAGARSEIAVMPNSSTDNLKRLLAPRIIPGPADLRHYPAHNLVAWQPQGVLDDQLVDENGEGVSYCKRLWKMKIALP